MTTRAPGRASEAVEQPTGQGEVAEMVGAELHLETVGGLAAGDGHDAGVVEQDVEAVVAGTEAIGEGRHRRQVGQVERFEGHVGGDDGTADAVEGVGALRLVPAGQDHLGAGPGQGQGRLEADAAVGPGHHGGAAGEVGDVVDGPCSHARHPTGNGPGPNRPRTDPGRVIYRGAMTYLPSEGRYEQMQYRRCGRSGITLPLVSLGVWQNFGDARPPDEIEAMLTRAFDLGITHFDLANNYGPPYGSAETNVGRVLNGALAPYRDELVLSTKAGYDMWPGPYGDGGSRKYVLASLDASLSRMGVEYVDIFYSHRFDPDTPLEETMGALDTAVRQGKALYVGISSYPPDQTAEAAEILARLGTPLLIHQPPYSMFNRWIEHGLLETFGQLDVGCIVFSPLAQGLLTDRYLDGIPEGSRASRPGTLDRGS